VSGAPEWNSSSPEVLREGHTVFDTSQLSRSADFLAVGIVDVRIFVSAENAGRTSWSARVHFESRDVPSRVCTWTGDPATGAVPRPIPICRCPRGRFGREQRRRNGRAAIPSVAARRNASRREIRADRYSSISSCMGSIRCVNAMAPFMHATSATTGFRDFSDRALEVIFLECSMRC